MTINPLEALADAIMAFEGWHVSSVSYRNRNPGNLRNSKFKTAMDAKGYAIFGSMPQGYQALIIDLTAKVRGHSAHKLTPDSTLQNLFDIYAPRADNNNPGAYALFVCSWLCKALGREFTPASRLRELDGGAPAPAAGSEG